MLFRLIMFMIFIQECKLEKEPSDGNFHTETRSKSSSYHVQQECFIKMNFALLFSDSGLKSNNGSF